MRLILKIFQSIYIKVSKYEDNIIDVELIQKVSNTKIEEIKVESFTDQVTREVKVYTEEDHLNHKSELIKDIYEKLGSDLTDYNRKSLI